MNSMKKELLRFLVVLILASFPLLNIFSADTPSFVVVLDAGHGGHDPGACGPNGQEKKINLGVVLALGEMINKADARVKVVYTRKTDVYLTLQERADVANSAHADLFISVHTNANNSAQASGSETYTLGLTKSKSNLDVAMRENAVILLEDDYKVKYEGFNPKSVDSYIMFECIQDKYLDKSVQIASEIQKNFASAGRKDRGVRQAGFWVLHKTAMPSVLVEVGYISNPEEESFLISDAGQQKMASAIYTAFEKFRHEYDRKSGKQNYVSAELGETASVVETTNTCDNSKEELSSKSNSRKKKAQKSDVENKNAEAEKLQAEMSKAMAQAEERKQAELETPVANTINNASVKEGTFSVISSSRRSLEPEKVRMVSMGDDGEIEVVSNVVVSVAPENTKSAAAKPVNTKPVEAKKVVVEAPVNNASSSASSQSKRSVVGVAPKVAAKKTVAETKVSAESSKTQVTVKNLTPSPEAKRPAVVVAPVVVEPKKESTETVLVESAKETEASAASADIIVYKVQLYAVSNVLPANSPKLKGLKADFFQEGGLFKYTYGSASDYESILKMQKQIVPKFPQTIIVVFKNGKKVPLAEMIK